MILLLNIHRHGESEEREAAAGGGKKKSPEPLHRLPNHPGVFQVNGVCAL